MADAWVFSPVSATLLYKDYYGCPSGPAHTIVGGSSYCCPMDIGWLASGTGIYFRGSSNILSIKVVHIDNVCANTSLIPWTYGVKVHLYKFPGAVCKIGTVLYGHLNDNRPPNGSIFDKGASSWFRSLGTVPSDCDCGCSDGIHVHMECLNTGKRTSLSCNSPVTAGSTWLYKFVVPDAC